MRCEEFLWAESCWRLCWFQAFLWLIKGNYPSVPSRYWRNYFNNSFLVPEWCHFNHNALLDPQGPHFLRLGFPVEVRMASDFYYFDRWLNWKSDQNVNHTTYLQNQESCKLVHFFWSLEGHTVKKRKELWLWFQQIHSKFKKKSHLRVVCGTNSEIKSNCMTVYMSVIHTITI